ncbi:hypothetical protein KIH27_14300 [Mycobacterium sp. M1]|uniref:DUF1023 domain-containing protein n=2 Tax=Mycolicibacter acidiphilus TaxID=2835306 RepID=A0ABS5RKJ7_9MYCO|nr:hypothetical protein [Mycolicibacter acidiphilus]
MTAGGAWPEADEDAYFRRADELSTQRKQLTTALEDWQRHETMLFAGSQVWTGSAANAAAKQIGRLTAAIQTHQQQFTAAIDQAHTTGGVLIWAKQQITANVEHAQAEIAEVQRNTEFTDAQKTFFAQGNTRATRSKNLAVIDTAVAKLGPAPTAGGNVRMVSNGTRVPLAPPKVPADDPLSKPIPEDPVQFHDFWESLTPAQKDALYERDHSIGNHPGMPVDPDNDHRGNDWYNKRHLSDDLGQAQTAGTRADALKAAHPDWADGKNIPRPNTPGAIFADRVAYEAWQHQYDAARDGAKHLPDLQSVDRVLKASPDRKLLLLDTESGSQAHAAIAVGNPDKADHVSVTAPGLNTTVRDSLGGMADEATHLRNEAIRQLSATPGHEHDTVATVAWVGYDTPQIPGMHDPGHSTGGGWDVTHDTVARSGAHDLARFYDGLQASHEGASAHMTAIGHSYGSLTTGLALQEPGNHGITDAIFYGSPGIEATTAQQLHLQPGHVYTMEAPDDPVQGAYDAPPIARQLAPVLPPPFNYLAEGLLGTADASGAGDFGPNPATNPNFIHLSTVPTTVPDGRHLDGASGHAQYPQQGDNGELRITGYNLAAVLAGLSDQAIPEK